LTLSSMAPPISGQISPAFKAPKGSLAVCLNPPPFCNVEIY
jgi:hypothetical protein